MPQGKSCEELRVAAKFVSWPGLEASGTIGKAPGRASPADGNVGLPSMHAVVSTFKAAQHSSEARNPNRQELCKNRLNSECATSQVLAR